MAKPSRSSDLSKKILLGVVIAATPVAGCDVAMTNGPTNAQYPINVPADEKAAFDAALASGRAADVDAFLRRYSSSQLVRGLLVRSPTATLQRVDASAVSLVDQAVLNSLPFPVQQALGLVTRRTSNRLQASDSDGYSG